MNEQDRLKLLEVFEQYQKRCDSNYKHCFKLYKSVLFLREFLKSYQSDEKTKDLIGQVESIIEKIQSRMEIITHRENELEKMIKGIQPQTQTPEINSGEMEN